MPFLNKISKFGLDKYQNFFHENIFNKGQIILKEGEEMINLHLIVEGEFEVSQ